MQFKQYPSYKPSGVEWLGDVPEHWDSCNLKFISKIYAGGTPDRNRLDYWVKGEIPWINSGAVNQVIIKEPSEYITELGLKNSSAKYIPVNSLVMALAGQGKTKGMVAYTSIETTCNQSMAAIVPKNYHYKFLYYWLDSNYQNIRNLTGGDNRDGLNLAVLSNIPCPKISIVEQTQIVSFLDTETARIDNLISKQEKLIELLEEQRKSIISHAVTKGLNPNAPMKDSGVEWLGDVPEHWMTPSSKHLLEIPITDGPHETPNFVDDGVPFISAEAISKGKIDFDKKRGYITPELNAIYSKKYSPKIEDIYMVKSGATTGKVAMVETTEEFNIWSPLAVFRCNKNKVLPKFLLAVFNSSHFYDALVLNWSYGTQQNIGMGVLSNIEIPCPPLKEQAEIIQHLDAQNTKFDKLISTQSQLIEKLKEYRSSIISHAVTGKIDVREFGA